MFKLDFKKAEESEIKFDQMIKPKIMLLSGLSGSTLKHIKDLSKSRLARDAEAAVYLMCFQGHWKKPWSPKYFPARRLKLYH